MFSVFLIPANTVTTSQLQHVLNGAGLTNGQKQEVLKLLKQQGYVTAEELQQAGLDETQIQQMIDIFKGETPSAPTITKPNLDSFLEKFSPNTSQFTKKQLSVISLLLQGKSNINIASQLGVCTRTIELHLTHIYDKLGVCSRTEAIIKLIDLYKK